MSIYLMRDGLEDKYGFLEVQNKILEIMVYIDKFCNNHNIEYCLMGGSALGAKRHGGFIPWDDDLDIFMTPDNYEKFRDEFNRSGDKEKFYLQEWGLTDGMVTTSKIRMNNTTYIEKSIQDWNIHHGIFVDIFILHNCPNNKIQQLHQFFWAKYVITKGVSLREKERHRGLKKIIIKIAQILPKKFLIKHGLKQVYKYRNKTTNYYCNFMGKAVFKKAIYKKEWFENYIYLPFETIELKVPKKLDEFLTERFGNYMQIPSNDKIKWEQHAESWNCNKQLFQNNFSDEKLLI